MTFSSFLAAMMQIPALVWCGSDADVNAYLAGKPRVGFGAAGLGESHGTTEVYVDPAGGEWSIVQRKDGFACILSDGSKFTPYRKGDPT
jgi:hypothetical protein